MRAPAVFVGRGSPHMALDQGDYAAALRRLTAGRPSPASVVVVSAGWREPEARVGAARQMETLHDFEGSSPELHALGYPCAGAPMLAHRIAPRIDAKVDRDRGLDHGAWVPLR